MDFQKAIQNLTDVLIDEAKFTEIQESIFEAIDTDNSGTLDKEEVKSFVANLLKGISPDSDNAANLLEKHKIVFAVLDDNESGEITKDELQKFLRELFKEQIKELQTALEQQGRNRGKANDDYDQSTNN
mgnify:FL=1